MTAQNAGGIELIEALKHKLAAAQTPGMNMMREEAVQTDTLREASLKPRPA